MRLVATWAVPVSGARRAELAPRLADRWRRRRGAAGAGPRRHRRLGEAAREQAR